MGVLKTLRTSINKLLRERFYQKTGSYPGLLNLLNSSGMSITHPIERFLRLYTMHTFPVIECV